MVKIEISSFDFLQLLLDITLTIQKMIRHSVVQESIKGMYETNFIKCNMPGSLTVTKRLGKETPAGQNRGSQKNITT